MDRSQFEYVMQEKVPWFEKEVGRPLSLTHIHYNPLSMENNILILIS
jgi:hypothetical protein